MTTACYKLYWIDYKSEKFCQICIKRRKILENGPNFGADVTPLNINIFGKNFAHFIFSLNGTILKSSILTFQKLLFFGPS